MMRIWKAMADEWERERGKWRENEKIFIMENCAKVVCENCCVKSVGGGGRRNLIIFVSFMFTLLTRQHFLASESCVSRSPFGFSQSVWAARVGVRGGGKLLLHEIFDFHQHVSFHFGSGRMYYKNWMAEDFPSALLSCFSLSLSLPENAEWLMITWLASDFRSFRERCYFYYKYNFSSRNFTFPWRYSFSHSEYIYGEKRRWRRE